MDGDSISRNSIVLLSAALLWSCGQRTSSNTEQQTSVAAPTRPTEAYFLKLKAKPVAPTKVEFTVSTNAPLPIETMADVTLVGLRDDETWIGEERKAILDKPITTFVLDTAQNGKRLPLGKYIAEIDYFQRWGADNNPAARNVPDMTAKKDIQLGGSGESTSHARSKAAMQRWVMGEMDFNRPWTDTELKSKLGPFERGRTHDGSFTYYFPDADVTLFVAPARHKVLTSRLGRIS